MNGLKYLDDVIDEKDEEYLLEEINKLTWNTDLKRRTQHYGFLYDYRYSRIDSSVQSEPFPIWLESLVEKLRSRQYLSFNPNQAIINEYLPGQGISPHIDRTDIFGETIASLSLGSGAVMTFSRDSSPTISEDIYLKRRSLIEMSDESRYLWKHSISARKSDVVNRIKIPRTTRVSITFRVVK